MRNIRLHQVLTEHDRRVMRGLRRDYAVGLEQQRDERNAKCAAIASFVFFAMCAVALIWWAASA